MSTYNAKKKYIGKIASKYDEKREDNPKWMKEIKIVGGMAKKLPAKTTLLDIPLGTGRFLNCYSGNNNVIFGIDASYDMLSEAEKKRTDIDTSQYFLAGDAEKLPLKNNSVNYIVSIRLVNWVPFSVLEGMIKEFCRVSNTGIMLSIRLKRNPTFVSFLRYCVMDILPTKYNAKRWRKKIKKRLRSVLDLVKGKRRNNPFLKGYTVHGEVQFLEMLKRYNLIVKECVQVETFVDYKKMEVCPYLIYMLQKA